MTRKEAEDYIYASYLRAERFQAYECKDAQKRTPALTRPIIESLNHTPCVCVTGSKGKGSVANMTSAILQTAHKVGLLTSPHIERFNERFRVDGSPIPDDAFIKAIESLKGAFDKIESALPDGICISPMGIQAAIGLEYFNSVPTSYNVFELGKGARYDDVNNINGTYSVINTIFLEHTRELGKTIAEIADDKSHIIKSGQKAVFVAEQDPDAMQIISSAASRLNVPLKIYGKDFRAERIRFTDKGMLFDVRVGAEAFTDIRVPLLGEHQAKNCALAMAVCRDIMPSWDLELIKERLAKIDWPGRMEILSSDPLTLLDACINRGSTGNIKNVLGHLGIGKCVFIVGIPDDKDFDGVVCSVQDVAIATILTKSQNPHYKFTDIQKKVLLDKGIQTLSSSSVEEAIMMARKYGSPIAILGTTSVIADVKKAFTPSEEGSSR